MLPDETPEAGGAGQAVERIAFRMRLLPGYADEYRRRHDEIWPELVELLRHAGVRDYAIYLDPETNALFAVLDRRRNHGMDALPDHPVMRRWWAMMADIMEVEADQAPVTVPLQPMFRME
ncbi:L-rhamnose mutarotase [Aurantimonas sp. VKM B-3413]|uniref:L-rhamnose mutarotase n=1 Tax=Aurantimonas sp. VKM B-3413 TaxID=2779401 RepID=UPI001E2DF257|nr:L-rhamnose mutarotase [Aurantimonas sp. VKM B-3413]MCB8837190.1 L-rhamnose mutarotase [Aurantimonas sp. VKM B-3413]